MSNYFDMMQSVREQDLLLKEHAQIGYSVQRKIDPYMVLSVLFIMLSIAISWFVLI